MARGEINVAGSDAELYQSTGETGGIGINTPSAWQVVNPGGQYYYFERLGCCDASQNFGYIWSVITGEKTSLGSRQRIENLFPQLTPGSRIIDSLYGNVFQLVCGVTGVTGATGITGSNCFWNLECSLRGNVVECICIKYNGLGGLSVPSEFGPDGFDLINLPGIYFLDYGNDGDLYITTGDENNFWKHIKVDEPFYYFQTATTTVDLVPNAGDIGRIWYISPSNLSSITNAPIVTKIENLLNLRQGDKVIDSNTGRIFTLICKDACECLWYAECALERGTKLITGCIEYTGTIRIADSLPSVDLFDVGHYILVTNLSPHLYQLQITSGSKHWVSINNTPEEYYFASTGTGIGQIGIVLYYVRNDNSLNSACNIADRCNILGPTGTISLGVQSVRLECNILPGDKFYDCKTGDFYTFGQALGLDCAAANFWTKSCPCIKKEGDSFNCVDILLKGWCSSVINPACRSEERRVGKECRL